MRPSLLEPLKQRGITIVAVADLDQSIFEFWRSEPDGVRAFANSLGTSVSLDGNYRSVGSCAREALTHPLYTLREMTSCCNDRMSF